MSYVYILSSSEKRSGERNRFKIGKAADKASRLKQLQAGNLDLLEVDSIETDDADACEKHLHKVLFPRRVGREFYELTDAELEDALRDARTYLEEDRPLKKKAAALGKQQSDDQLLQPGDRERQIYRALQRACVGKYLAETHYEHCENEMKLVIGASAGLEGLVSWKTETAMRFDEGAFKAAYPELHQAFLRPRRRRPFRLL
jgi:hypothetical protein